jgi:ribose transport system permease protein
MFRLTDGLNARLGRGPTVVGIPRRPPLSLWSWLLSSRAIVIAPLLLFSISISVISPNYLSVDNVLQVLRQASIPGIIALGVTFVVISGNLDLSVGSLLSLTTVIVIDLHDSLGSAGAIFVCLTCGVAVGAVNGILVGLWRINSLIATLAMLSIIAGVTRIYTGGKSASMQTDPSWFVIWGQGYFAGVPIPVWVFLVASALLGVLLKYTTFGRKVFAVGGNELASTFSGLGTRAVVFKTDLLSGGLTAVAAVILGSRVMGTQLDIGAGYEMNVFAAIILGGTSLLGGAGSILRTFAGVTALGFVQNGLLQLGWPYYAQWLATWMILIVAVWADLASSRWRIFA